MANQPWICAAATARLRERECQTRSTCVPQPVEERQAHANTELNRWVFLKQIGVERKTPPSNTLIFFCVCHADVRSRFRERGGFGLGFQLLFNRTPLLRIKTSSGKGLRRTKAPLHHSIKSHSAGSRTALWDDGCWNRVYRWGNVRAWLRRIKAPLHRSDYIEMLGGINPTVMLSAGSRTALWVMISVMSLTKVACSILPSV